MDDTRSINRYKRSIELAEKYEAKIDITGGVFFLRKSNLATLGAFETVSELYSFLLGYDWGRNDLDSALDSPIGNQLPKKFGELQ